MDPDQAKREAHASLMRELLQSPLWDCLEEYLSLMVQDAIERALEPGADGFHKGVVAGLRDALRAPQAIVFQAERGRN